MNTDDAGNNPGAICVHVILAIIGGRQRPGDTLWSIGTAAARYQSPLTFVA
jgi:hypothetical protein